MANELYEQTSVSLGLELDANVLALVESASMNVGLMKQHTNVELENHAYEYILHRKKWFSLYGAENYKCQTWLSFLDYGRVCTVCNTDGCEHLSAVDDDIQPSKRVKLV